MDIREHYERKLERANNLYMELSAIMLQLEMREKELIKYASRPLSALVDVVYPSAEMYYSFMLLLLRTGRCLIHSPNIRGGRGWCAQSLPLGRFPVEWSCRRAGSRGACTDSYLSLHPAEWLREGCHFMESWILLSGGLLPPGEVRWLLQVV